MLDAPVTIASGGGVGFLRPAPGTWGSGVGVLLGMPFILADQIILVGVCAGLVVLAGMWAIARLPPSFTQDDPRIVIDEIAGMLLALMACAPDGADILFAFVVFRALDILKPWPIDSLERMPGALGVMMDDLAAGLLTALVVMGTKTWMI